MASRSRLLVGLMILVSTACRGAPPQGKPGTEADSLARAMQTAVDANAWGQTGAVKWNFAGRNQHLWDRRRGLSKVAWGDTEVLLDIDARQGVAF